VQNPAAWHPDPTGAHDHRWWDGERWTEHVADAGVAAVDPLPGAGGPSQGDTAGSTTSEGTQELGTTDTRANEATSAIDHGAAPGAERGRDGDAQGAGQAGSRQPAWTEGGPQQQPWGSDAPQAGWGDQRRAAEGPLPASGLAITALVLGILSIPLGIILIGGVLAIAAIICGAIAASRAKKGRAGGRGLAIGGIITGVVGLIVTGMLIVAAGSVVTEIAQCIEETGDQQFCQDLAEDQLMERFG
jgi:hypothetical protein